MMTGEELIALAMEEDEEEEYSPEFIEKLTRAFDRALEAIKARG